MKIHELPQGSPEWFGVRAGIATASEFDQILTPKFEARRGEMPEKYLARKLAEKWLGGPLPSFGFQQPWVLEQGKIREGEAIPWYELEYNCTIDRPGFITDDAGLAGCSPDGLIGEDGGIEVKCPEAPAHCRYVMHRVVPDEYLCQVYGSMFITGRRKWTFLSYRRRFPCLVVQVTWVDEIMEKIKAALDQFNCRMQQAWDLMVELNGGEPERTTEMPYNAWRESLSRQADEHQNPVGIIP